MEISNISRVLFVYSIWQVSLMSCSNIFLDALTVEAKLFHDFVNDFGKLYESATEYAKRLDIFKNNLKIIDYLNNDAQDTAIYRVTKFADLTSEEFKAKMLRVNTSHYFQSFGPPKYRPTPQRIQRRAQPKTWQVVKGDTFGSWHRGNPYYPPAEDQGDSPWCGIFGMVDALSLMYSVQQKRPISLSKQQVVDCCDSRNTTDFKPMYKYIRENYLTSADDYPFNPSGEIGECNRALATKGVAGFHSAWRPHTEQHILYALRKSPVAISIVADNWQHYQSGILSKCDYVSTQGENHVVLIVEHGYELDENRRATPYYLLRNSWGPDFGIYQGHLKLKRGVCRVERDALAFKLKVKKTGCFGGLCRKN